MKPNPTLSLEPHERLVFALDVETEYLASRMLERLFSHIGLFKVGLELLSVGGMELVDRLFDTGTLPVPLIIDAKLHDIPATVARAVKRIVNANLDVRYITVHNAVREASLAAGSQAGILLVTLLTSEATERFGDQTALQQHVVNRAVEAQREGAAGVVCAATEARLVRAATGPDFVIMCPAIRPAWSLVAGDDQARIATPEFAIKEGATLLVVGRPIRDAVDPVVAADKIVAEIEAATRRASTP